MPRGGTWSTVGGWGSKKISPKFNQIRCVSYSHECAIFLVPAPWGLGEGSKIIYLNMVMWHIKLKGMGSIPGYTEKF